MVAGLMRRISQFRYLGYAMLGSGFLVMDAVSVHAWLLVMTLGVGWPACLHLLGKTAHAYPQGPRYLQGCENFAGPLCAAVIQFPAAQFMALLVSLLSGNIAQGGMKRMPEALIGVAFGWMAGDWARTRLGVELHLHPTVLSESVAYAHILLFTALISAAGYDRSLRMHHARRELREKSKTLQAFSDRIARYVDPRLSKRLRLGEARELPHRRLWISACFVDLVGFTHMTGRMAPEAVCEVVNLFLASISRLSASAGGRVDKFLGDGVLITFGDTEAPSAKPLPRGGVADAMMAFCARIPEAIFKLNKELDERALSTSLSVRVGAASGYCTVGDFGEGERLDYTVIGPAVNLASRLEALAPVGGLLIDEATHKLASESWPRVHAGGREIKGVSERVNLWQMEMR